MSRWIVEAGYEPYISVLQPWPTHPGAVEIPDELAERFERAALEFWELEAKIRAIRYQATQVSTHER